MQKRPGAATRKSIVANTARPCTCRILPRSKINVAGQGMISVFGLTLPPKEKRTGC